VVIITPPVVAVYDPFPLITVPDTPLSVILEVVLVCDPLFVYIPVSVSVLVLAPRIPPLLIVIPATVVVATSVTVSPVLIVIVSATAGVTPPQLVHVAARLKAPPPVPFDWQVFAASALGTTTANIRNEETKNPKVITLNILRFFIYFIIKYYTTSVTNR
jgi:hypothetical protein